jgi:succinyl-CoA synthetase alpha subunit
LTLNACQLLSAAGLGQSTVVHIGGDVICGRNPHEWLAMFLDDPATDLVVYLGEPGGSKEYAMLDLICSATKPVVALIVGRHAPRDKRMGHAGALVGSDKETAHAKIAGLREAGAHISLSPLAIPEMARGLLVSTPRHVTAAAQ